MSNHDGIYILNEVLLLLEQYGFFSGLIQDKTLEFIKDIVLIGDSYDCNDGEIFDEIGQRLNYCFYCKKYPEGITEDDLCGECLSE